MIWFHKLISLKFIFNDNLCKILYNMMLMFNLNWILRSLILFTYLWSFFFHTYILLIPCVVVFHQFHVSFSLNGTAHLSLENKPSIVSDLVDFFLTTVGATFTEMKDVELK